MFLPGHCSITIDVHARYIMFILYVICCFIAFKKKYNAVRGVAGLIYTWKHQVIYQSKFYHEGLVFLNVV